MSTAVVAGHEYNSYLPLDEILSQYVYSSHKTYKSLWSDVKCKDQFDEGDSNMIRSSSINFRLSVHEFVRMLSAFAEELDQSGVGSVDVVDGAIDIINDSQKLWHITEFFVLAPSQSLCMDTIMCLQGMIEDCDCLPFHDLLEYYKTCSEPERSDLNDNSNGPYNDGFWGVVFDLVLRGKLNMAWSILSTHSELRSLKTHSHEIVTLKRIFQSHPFCFDDVSNEENDEVNRGDSRGWSVEGLSKGSNAREKTALWMEWHQMVSDFRNERSSIVGRITELEMLFKLMLGEERALIALTSKSVSSTSPDGHVSWGSSRADWKTVAICLLLFAKPALSRAEVGRCLEQGMQLRIAGTHNESHHQSIVRQLIHGDVGPLLKSLYERSHFGISADSAGMDTDESVTSSIEGHIHKVASVVILLACTHISQLLQLVGVLDGHTGNNRRNRGGGSHTASTVQKDFVENIARDAVTKLAELNFPIEVLMTYIAHACPTSGSSCVQALVTRHPIETDSDALKMSSSLASLQLHDDAATVLVARGIYWLKKSLRTSPGHATLCDATARHARLFRLGGMEAKALVFFLRAYDSSRCRNLLDVCMRRCIVSTCHHEVFAASLRLKYQEITDLLPVETPSAAEAKHRPQKGETIVPIAVESMITCGILGAVESVADMHLCHIEAFALRHYSSALQNLVKVDTFEVSGSDTDTLRKMVHRVDTVRKAADSLKELITPLDTDNAGTLKICASSAAYGCPQRYWAHIVDICVCVNSLYNDLRAETERIATLLQGKVTVRSDEDELMELVTSFRASNPHVLFSRINVQRMMALIQMGSVSYLQNKSHLCNKSAARELHFLLLQMNENAMCYENYKASQASNVQSAVEFDYRAAQKTHFAASVSSGDGGNTAVRSSLALQITDDAFHNTSGLQVSRLEEFLTAPQSSLSLRLHS